MQAREQVAHCMSKFARCDDQSEATTSINAVKIRFNRDRVRQTPRASLERYQVHRSDHW
jgi:hypothetical protein